MLRGATEKQEGRKAAGNDAREREGRREIEGGGGKEGESGIVVGTHERTDARER